MTGTNGTPKSGTLQTLAQSNFNLREAHYDGDHGVWKVKFPPLGGNIYRLYALPF